MKIQKHTNVQNIKVILGLVLIMTAILHSHSVNAQRLRRFVHASAFGFEGSFGMKTFSLASNIPAINGLNVIEEGGNIGVAIGAKALRIRIRQGYFYSSSSVIQTVDEVRSAIAVNFYPLQVLTGNDSRLRPYFIGGIERNILKMYGTYGSENIKPRNYSISEAPFLGKISNTVAAFGGGFEYSVRGPGHFVKFFAEARYGKTIGARSSNVLFNETATSNQLAVDVGVGFGYHK